MAARILSFLLGVLLAGIGWAIVAPKGLAGIELPPIDLAMFEGHRPFIGWGAVALGIVALLSAVLPKGDGPKGGKRRGPPVVDFDAAPEPAAETAPHGEPANASHASHPAVAAEPAEPEIVAPPTPTPKPPPRTEALADVPETAGFEALRGRLKTLVQTGQWTEAAALARRLSVSASSDEEHLVAACDLGDFARSQGAADEAAEAYDTALSYARKLQAAAPEAPARLEALAGVLIGVGDSAQDEGRLDAAVDAYEEGLALRRRLVAITDSPDARRALSLALERLADVREDRGHRVRALDLYRESFDIAGKLASLDPQKYGEDLAVTRRRLAELEAKLAAV